MFASRCGMHLRGMLALVLTGSTLPMLAQSGGKAPEVRNQKEAGAQQPEQAVGSSAAKLSAESMEGLAEKTEQGDQPADAERFYLLKRLPAGASLLPTEKYTAAREHMRSMPRYSTPANQVLPSEVQAAGSGPSPLLPALGTWMPLGPGNIGGRIRAIVIDPTSPNTMYLAGVAGGVWKSLDGGNSWTALNDVMGNLAVNTLAMDPGNHNTLYAGTGEGFFNIDAVNGNGIFKSTDGGATWTQLAATAGSGPFANFAFVNKILVSPNNSSRVYASTRMGIFRSIDGGASWTQVFSVSASVRGCFDMVIRTDITVTDSMLATCGTFLASGSTIYQNTDAGGAGTWNAVYTEANMGLTSLALAPSNQSTVYAMAAQVSGGTFNNGLQAVFRSTSGGNTGTWTAQWRNTGTNTNINNLLLTNPVIANLVECGFGGPDSFSSQGWYDNVLAVDPTNPNVVWAGGIDLFRSNDGGTTWGLASYWWDSPAASDYAHADQHAIVFHPQYNGTSNQTLFVGNDGGIFKTTNALAATGTNVCNPLSTSLSWTSLNNGLSITQFYDGVAYPNGMTYFGGTQDNGTDRGTDAGGPNAWSQILGGDGGYVAVDATNTNILYAETTGLSIRKSTNGGTSFSLATSGISDSGFPFIATFMMDPGNSQNLWTGGSFIWRTTNAAGSWQQASTAIGDTLTAIAVHPANSNLVLVGGRFGHIFRNNAALSANSGTIWASAQPNGSTYVSWLAWDPTNQNVAYATFSTFGVPHLWKSTNAGASWTSIDGSGITGFPDIPAHSIVVDPVNPTNLYVGSDLGVFTSIDGGSTWNVENTGFANVVVDALSITSRAGTNNVYAFTHGRGAWRAPVASGAQPPTIAKAFAPTSVPLNTNSTLSFNISNPNSSIALTGITFTDSLPSGLVVATPNGLSNTCSGAATAVAGSGSVSLAASTLAASASCTVSVNVRGITLGPQNNSVTVNSSQGQGNTSNATLTVVKDDTMTAVGSSVNPSVFGQSVTFTATVSAVPPATGTPTGTVQFVVDGTNFGPPATLSGGSATSNALSSLSAGSHTITAAYSGDPSFNTSTSAPLTQTVNRAATTTAFGVDINPSTFAQTVKFTATVTVNAPGSGAPSGSVTFMDGATVLAAESFSGGTASFATNALAIGVHTIASVYSGDSNFTGSTSSGLTQTVTGTTAGPADIGVTVAHSPNNPNAVVATGAPLRYTITVTHHSIATTAHVTLNLSQVGGPSSLVSFNSTPGTSCAFGTGAIQCNIPALAPGASETVTLVLQLSFSDFRTFTGIASVSTNTVDSGAFPHYATDTVNPRPRPRGIRE